MPIELDLLDDLWAGVADELPRPDVTLAGPPDRLPAALPAGAAATATVATALAAAAALAGLRNGRTPALRVDRAHVAAAVRSERAFLVDGRPSGAGFAALSRFWRTGDGYVRTHANYAWHRAALLRVLELAADAEVDAVAAELARRSAGDVEDFVFAAGGVAARVRTGRDWAEHPQGRAVAAEPLVSHAVVGPGRPRARPRGLRPAEDVRVLDLTRVIAGPVCTRLLGALGADVLRIDPPDRNDIPPGTYADTLLGKRSAVLDLTRQADRAHALLEHADVLVCGYRPGALDRFGLTDADLAARHPGLVVVRLAAWGHTGLWRHRRGFDSVVQAGVGIADLEGDVAGPGALPCQLLDHGTGYLAAAAVLDGLRRQADSGGTLVRRVSLARTAAWLLAAPRTPSTATADEALDDWTVRIGPVQAVAPPGAIDGAAAALARTAEPLPGRRGALDADPLTEPPVDSRARRRIGGCRSSLQAARCREDYPEDVYRPVREGRVSVVPLRDARVMDEVALRWAKLTGDGCATSTKSVRNSVSQGPRNGQFLSDPAGRMGS